ncbi:MAG: GNAT family N-acetyltransferase [Planctomycetes bacterium]|nr:GNAT family N-acetyltransferase [Planctomycetota bacterium]
MYDDIVYDIEQGMDAAELAVFYRNHNHPTGASNEQLLRMLDESFCFVTARRGGELIGFARGVTDGVVGRLVECKLDPKYQGPACLTRKDGRIEHDDSGIASQMARRVIDALRSFGAERIDVTAHGTEVDFCEELGFKKMAGMVAMGLPCPLRSQEPASSSRETAKVR